LTSKQKASQSRLPGIAAIVFAVIGIFVIAAAFLTRGRFSDTGADKPIVPG
jgi:hypothetical protein